MNVAVNLSDIDFSTYNGQKVIDVIPVGTELFRVVLGKGSINVECTWRMRNSETIITSPCERQGVDFISILKMNLKGKSITRIYHFTPTEDLIIGFNNELYLDLFADSSTFEHYQLYKGDTLFLIG